MEDTTFTTTTVRLALINSHLVIPLYLAYQFTVLRRRGRTWDKIFELMCHMALTHLWYTILYLLATTDPGLHAHAHDEMPKAQQRALQKLQGVRSVTNPGILVLGAALCILSVMAAYEVKEYNFDERPTINGQPTIDGQPTVDENTVVEEEPITCGGEHQPDHLVKVFISTINFVGIMFIFVALLCVVYAEWFLWHAFNITWLVAHFVEEWILGVLLLPARVLKMDFLGWSPL